MREGTSAVEAARLALAGPDGVQHTGQLARMSESLATREATRATRRRADDVFMHSSIIVCEDIACKGGAVIK